LEVPSFSLLRALAGAACCPFGGAFTYSPRSQHIILGGGGGSFPLDDGRTLDAIDLFTERGYKVEFQKYWLTSLPAGGSEWQPSWFQNALAAEKGKTVPVFIVYYVPHLFFPNWNDHSNPLPYDTALSPANQAAYLAYIDRFGDFAATLTGDVYVTLEPEYNIVVPLQVRVLACDLCLFDVCVD
jgi:hypothetical protein